MKVTQHIRNHPIIANIVIIMIVAVIGLVIAYILLNLFTRHDEMQKVPAVENEYYTEAITTLKKQGFRVELRDSVYNETVKPGYVIEQFPRGGAHVKPGRKIFLYINALNPREVIIDSDNTTGGYALKGYSRRQGLAKLEELGFHNINVITLPGENDRIIRILSNGKVISKMQKVPVNALITVEISDGKLNQFNDSLLNEEYIDYLLEEDTPAPEGNNSLILSEPDIFQ